MPSLDSLESICHALRVPLYLIVLLASEEKDLRGIGKEQAHLMGRELLSIALNLAPAESE